MVIFFSTRLVLPKINFMTIEEETGASWRDDLVALIRRKQEENELLRKVQKSFQPGGRTVYDGDLPVPSEDDTDLRSDNDEIAFYSDDNQFNTNDNNQQ
jgi:hypothetical protein